MKTIKGILGITLGLLAASAMAEVKLPSIFSNYMMLQREAKLCVWGWADNGEEVTVKLDRQTAKAVAANGKWQVVLEPMKAGGPYDLAVSGKNTLTFKNVMLGEVWICSGQSNMVMPLSNVENGREAIAQANIPNLRIYNGNRCSAMAGLRISRILW